MSPVLAALMIPFLGTALGSAFVFFIKRDMPVMLQKVLLGFASGVMVAASVWSLIIPAIDMAVTIHNFPEGMAVGVAIAGALAADFNIAGAMALSLGIAIQNVPEGAIISMPLRAEGNGRWRAFGIGALSGIVEPVGGALVLLLATYILGIMPYMLAFAAGAMLYVVVEELVPDYSQGKHSNIGTIGFALGFALMMVLDVVLG